MKVVRTTDNQRLGIELAMGEHGWACLRMSLTNPRTVEQTKAEQSVCIDLSDVFDPFADIVAWIDDIARASLPASISINEEGHISNISVQPTTPPEQVMLCVTGSRDDVVHLQALCDRRLLADKLRLELLRFFRHDFDPAHWGAGRRDDDSADIRHMVLTHVWADTL